MVSSRAIISHFMPSAEYSANNYYNYNGNNGNLNNNNKNNTLRARPVLELRRLLPDFEALPFPLSEFYDTYRTTRRHKTSKPSHLVFAQCRWLQLANLCYEVYANEYQPTRSIAFIITRPKPREVIAADFRDRVVQTLLVVELLPHLEQYEHPHSYSCRVGKGSLAAVQRFKELNDKYQGGYVCFLDFANHFMSIDTRIWAPRLQTFIDEHYDEGEERKALLKRIADIIYYHRPQDNCIKMSPESDWVLIPERKSLFHSEVGLPIGNVTSQMLSNFITTEYLYKLEAEGFEFGFYTDDTGIFTYDKERLLALIPRLRTYLKDECGITLHPDKVYFQHLSKGFNALGFRIKGDNITPSKRIVHNFHLLIDNIGHKIYRHCGRARQRLNSYLGLLGKSHSYNIRKAGMSQLQQGGWSRTLRFPAGYNRVEIKSYCTQEACYLRQNRIRRKQQLNIINDGYAL